MVRTTMADDSARPIAVSSTAIDVTLTFEQCLYGIVFGLALLLRLWHLGTVPLDAAESETALQSWWMARGLPASIQGSPLLIYLNALNFFIFGAGDAGARFIPALAGSILAVLPYYARSFIGRGAALTAAILMSVSPTAVFFSRYVGAAPLVAVFSLGAALCFAHWARARSLSKTNDVPLYGGLVLLALLVANGLAGYVDALLILAFGAGLALLRWFHHKVTKDKKSEKANWLPSCPLCVFGERSTACTDFWRGTQWRKLALVFAGTLLLGVTGLLANPHGIQEGTAALVMRSSLAPASLPFSSYLQPLLAYEGLIAVFAAANIILFSGRMRLFHWFLLWWIFASLVVFSSMPDRAASFVMQPLVPLALLAADLIARTLRWLQREKAVIPFAVLTLVGGPSFLLIGYVYSGFAFQSGNTPAPFALIPMVVLVLATVGSVYWRGPGYAARLWSAVGLLLLSGLFLHTSTNLNLQTEANPADLLRSKTTTTDVLNLASDVDQALDSIPGGAVGPVMRGDVVVTGPDKAVLGWYLRKHQPKYSLTGGKPLIVVGTSDAEVPAGDWAMQQYSIAASAAPKWTTLGSLWGWLIYREPPTPPLYEKVVVYVSL